MYVVILLQNCIPKNGGSDLTLKPVAQRIPISLLELNTFGHAICALLIYLLWWEKPFEVDIPTTIESQVVLDLYALAWICTGAIRSVAKSPLVQSMESDFKILLEASIRFQGPNSVSLLYDPSQYPDLPLAASHRT